MDIKTCIFDLDGVLVDSARYHFLAWKRLAEELGFEFKPEHNERLKGVSRMTSLDILLEIGGIEIPIKEKEKYAGKKNQWFVDYIMGMTPDEVLSGVKPFLEELRMLNIKIALGSASKNARTILNQIELTDYFDAIVDGTMVSAAKPDPEVFLKAAALCQTPVAHCLVFEDAVAGIQAAHNGGIVCVGVGDQRILGEADVVIEDFKELSFSKLIEKLDR